MDKEDMKENLDWLREDGFLQFIPIKTDFKGEKDIIIALNNIEIEDDYLYEIDLEAKDKTKQIRRSKKEFKQIIQQEVRKINVKKRCKNSEKIRLTEFRIEEANFEKVLIALKESKIRQLTKWVDKYHPINPFGSQIAKFEMFEKITIEIERDEEGRVYNFEIEESILQDKDNSLVQKTKVILEESKLNFEKIECDLIETN